MGLSSTKRLAAQLGLDWRDVELLAADAIERANVENATEYAIRKDAYWRLCHPGKRNLPFWKSLGQWNNPQYNGAFGGGNDWTVIQRFDEVAHDLATIHPCLAATGDPSETLYRLLVAPVSTVPTRREALAEAIETLKEYAECSLPTE